MENNLRKELKMIRKTLGLLKTEGEFNIIRQYNNSQTLTQTKEMSTQILRTHTQKTQHPNGY